LRAAHAVVLIIAEDPVAREVYTELFLLRGHEVVTAGCAREGLRHARDRHIGVAIIAMTTGAAPLRRRLHALRPMLRVHVTGMRPLPLDATMPTSRQHLH
jgi:DNA-binding NtrC family response regulator